MILAILYGAVSLFYLIYVFVVFILGEKVNSHVRVLFPFIHTYIYKKELKIISLGAVAIMTLIVMFGLMEGAIWAIIAAIILSLWEIYLSFKFYYPRKERINALGHFGIHSYITSYLIIIIVEKVVR